MPCGILRSFDSVKETLKAFGRTLWFGAPSFRASSQNDSHATRGTTSACLPLKGCKYLPSLTTCRWSPIDRAPTLPRLLLYKIHGEPYLSGSWGASTPRRNPKFERNPWTAPFIRRSNKGLVRKIRSLGCVFLSILSPNLFAITILRCPAEHSWGAPPWRKPQRLEEPLHEPFGFAERVFELLPGMVPMWLTMPRMWHSFLPAQRLVELLPQLQILHTVLRFDLPPEAMPQAEGRARVRKRVTALLLLLQLLMLLLIGEFLANLATQCKIGAACGGVPCGREVGAGEHHGAAAPVSGGCVHACVVAAANVGGCEKLQLGCFHTGNEGVLERRPGCFLWGESETPVWASVQHASGLWWLQTCGKWELVASPYRLRLSRTSVPVHNQSRHRKNTFKSINSPSRHTDSFGTEILHQAF